MIDAILMGWHNHIAYVGADTSLTQYKIHLGCSIDRSMRVYAVLPEYK